jgi:AAA domain
MRKQVTVLVAPSGSGKSLLTIQMGLAFGDGQPWANWRPRAKLRVLMVNSEDDILEQRRRFAAALRVMEVDRESINDKVVLAESTLGIIIAKFHSSTKTMVATPLLEKLVETVKRHNIDWICVDPFAETFEGEENNNELKWAAILWREVARRCNVAVILVHHTKKYAHDMAGDVDAARGASALIGVARIVSTLFSMSKTEAQVMSVKDDERHDYLRYDDAKANLNKKSPFAKWFKKVSITLDNARGDIPGDEVGALTPWSPPGLMDGITDDDITRLMHRVDQGMLDKNGLPTGEYYTFSTRRDSDDDDTTFRWVGVLVKEVFKIKEDSRAAQMIKAWRDADPPRLLEYKYQSKRQRKKRNCVHSDLWQPPPEPEPEPPTGGNVVELFDGKSSDATKKS